MRIVMKFGGTSVGSAEAIQRVVEIVRRSAQEHEIVVVVSAMNSPDLRTTDSLIASAQAAANGESEAVAHLTPRLLNMYTEAASDLTTPAERDMLKNQLGDLFAYITNLSRCIAVLGELTPRALDLISGQGERCNARLIAAALRSSGMDAEAVDATKLIITDDRYSDATPYMEQTRTYSRQHLLPMLERGRVPVVTGFIGATQNGIPTTLGRGGSDYTCAILGSVLDADEVWFWKEVDGVLTANPKIVPDAHTLATLSYTEMAEMSYYGANVLHPRTVYPLVQRAIPIRIRNTFNPEHTGTCISGEASTQAVKAVTAINDVSLIRVGGPGMLGLTGMAARIFSAVARAGANILLITQGSSEQNICLAVPQRDSAMAVNELRRELASDISYHDVEHVDVTEPVCIIAVVGSGMHGVPGIAGQACNALGNEHINIIALAQGSTEYNISMVVGSDDGDRAMRVIHDAFKLGKTPNGA